MQINKTDKQRPSVEQYCFTFESREGLVTNVYCICTGWSTGRSVLSVRQIALVTPCFFVIVMLQGFFLFTHRDLYQPMTPTFSSSEAAIASCPWRKPPHFIGCFYFCGQQSPQDVVVFYQLRNSKDKRICYKINYVGHA